MKTLGHALRLINPKDAKVVKECVPVTVSATAANVRQGIIRFSMKVPLALLLLTTFTALSSAQSEVSSTVNFHSLALETRIRRQIGVWEEVEFSYSAFKNVSGDVLLVRTPDQGRGLCGAIVTLEYPDGNRRVWGQRYVDPAEYPPHFTDEPQLADRVEPEKAMKSQTIDLRGLFGDLAAGRYKLQVKIPGERYRLNGQAGGNLESEWLAFEIAPLSEKVQDALKLAQPRDGKITLIPETNVVTAKSLFEKVACVLENNLRTPFSISHEFGIIVHNVEVLDASLKWRDLGPARDCGNGLIELRVNPGTTRNVTVMVPGRRGFYRATLPKAGDGGRVSSPPIQIVKPLSP